MPAETPAQERAWRAAKAAEAKRLEEEQKQVTPIELKKEEYKTFATEYVAPVVETAKASPVPEVGLAETLAQVEVKPLIDVPRILGVPRTPQEALTPATMREETVRPYAGIAGVIAGQKHQSIPWLI